VGVCMRECCASIGMRGGVVVKCTYSCLLLLQGLVSVTAVVSQAGILVGVLWARAGGMMNGSELGTRP
jgi:hypothetical protein